MSEQDFWIWLRGKMQQYWLADRVENMTRAGMPDVAYTIPLINGWIELKFLRSFPKRPTTCIRIDHYTDIQKHWIKTHGEVGGNVWVMALIGCEVFLFDHKVAPNLEEMTAGEWRKHAVGFWTKDTFKPASLFTILKDGGSIPRGEKG